MNEVFYLLGVVLLLILSMIVSSYRYPTDFEIVLHEVSNQISCTSVEFKAMGKAMIEAERAFKQFELEVLSESEESINPYYEDFTK